MKQEETITVLMNGTMYSLPTSLWKELKNLDKENKSKDQDKKDERK